MIDVMTLDRWRRERYCDRGARVMCDGVDITDRCYEFVLSSEEQEGLARCYVKDEYGRVKLADGGREIERETLRGLVVITEKAAT